MIDWSLLSAYFARHQATAVAWLFGSQARNQAGALSDIDIAVLLSETIPHTEYLNLQLQMLADLTALAKITAVDLIILNEAPLTLSYRVLRDGRLLYCRDDQARVNFTASTVSQYLDFEPFLQRYEQTLIEQAQTGQLIHGYNPHRGTIERHRQRRARLERATTTHSRKE